MLLTILDIPFKMDNFSTNTSIFAKDDGDLIVIARNNLQIVRIDASRSGDSFTTAAPINIFGTSVGSFYVRAVERKLEDGTRIVLFAHLLYSDYYVETVRIYSINLTTGEMTSGTFSLGTSVTNNYLRMYALDFCPVTSRVILSWMKTNNTGYDKWQYMVVFNYNAGAITAIPSLFSLGYWYVGGSTAVSFSRTLVKGNGDLIMGIYPQGPNPELIDQYNANGVPGGVVLTRNGDTYAMSNPLKASYVLVDTDGSFIEGAMTYVGGGSANTAVYSSSMFKSASFNGVSSNIPITSTVDNHLIPINGKKYYGIKRRFSGNNVLFDGIKFENNKLTLESGFLSLNALDNPEISSISPEFTFLDGKTYAKRLAVYDGTNNLIRPLALYEVGSALVSTIKSRISGFISGG